MSGAMVSQEASTPDTRWNFMVFLIDSVSWNVAFSFVGFDSVMPLLVSRLTDSAPVIGLVGALHMAGWTLPQLAVGRWIQGKPRKKPYLMMGLAGRVMFIGMPLALWLGLPRYPKVMLGVFFVLLAIHAMVDSLATVSLFDIMSRSISARRRSRLFSTVQVISGILGIGVGAWVSWILESPSLPFPMNQAMLFTLAAIAIIPSTVSLSLVREPVPREVSSSSNALYLTSLKPVMKDKRFRRMMACQVLVMMMQLASPFFTVHASEELQLPDRIVGSFVVALAGSGLISSLVLGFVSEQLGPREVIRIGSGIAVLAPIGALLIHEMSETSLVKIYPVVFVALGAFRSIRMLGFRNYLMGIAKDGVRTLYIGLSNTILSGLALMPVLGGWLLESTSYGILFLVAVVLTGSGFLISWTLKPLDTIGKKAFGS